MTEFWFKPKGVQPKAYDLSAAARRRRQQLHLSIANMRHKVPFARFLSWTANIWFVTNFMVFFFNWPFGFLEKRPELFLVYTAISCTYIAFAKLYSWVQGRWDETVRVKVDSSPEWVADGLVPGRYLDNVPLPVVPSEENPKGERKDTPVELILCKYVNGIPRKIHARTRIVIAAATIKGEHGGIQAGVMKGNVYEIDATPGPYVAADLENWRLDVYYELAKKHFGDEVTDATEIIIAMDRVKRETGEIPKIPPTIVRELYDAKQRVQQLQNELDEYTLVDKGRAGTGTGGP